METARTRLTRLQLLAASPAAIALCACLLLYIGTEPRGPNQLDWSRTAADAAMDKRDFKTASVCYARLLQARPGDLNIAFNLAHCLQATNQPEGAHSLMAQLAGQQYLPACVWLAEQDLSAPLPTPDALNTASHYLSTVLKLQPEDSDANYWQAVLDAQAGNWDAVPKAAAKVSGQQQDLSRRLNAIARSQNNDLEMKIWPDH